MALAAIYQALPKDVLLMRVKEAKVQTLKTQFEAIRMKNGELVDDFSMKLTFIFIGIRSLGEKIVTLIEEFGDLKNMIVEEIIGHLKVHDERLRGYEYQEEKYIFLTHDEWMPRMKKNGEANFSSRSSSRSDNGGDNRYGNYASQCPNKRSDNETNLTSFYDEESALMFVEVVKNVLPKDDDENLTSLYDEKPVLMFVKGVTNAFPEDEKTNLEEFMQEPYKEELEVVLLNEEKVMEKLLASGDECNHTNMWYLDN
ncbi:uncharacterized protein LOC124934857 [Impatiens glandulifera]|uniref:uncharacterized protein LOC124934857 n=1 Tax=Impatiens glandulifera TaxID=253017 RepID=UPI001FB09690|nr:uncharacterized protein LOC124934857 [Impatiens glandulifera]